MHRFADPIYGELSLAMRTGENPDAVFEQLYARGHIVVHADEAARTAALVDAAEAGALVVADTREQVADLNAAIHDRLIAAGEVDGRRGLVTAAGERLCVGDKVATRRNDYDLGVANRDTWTVTGLDDDGTLHLDGQTGERTLPVGYAAAFVELAYATTCYGAQGETTTQAHLLLGEHTGAASAYVAMTRGRENNTAHLVADSLQDARRHWIQAFARDRADLGPTHAAELAAQESAKYLNGRPLGRGRYVPRSRRPSSARPARGTAPLPTPAPARDPGRAPEIGF